MIVKCLNNITYEFEMIGVCDDDGDPILSNYYSTIDGKYIYSIEINECYTVYGIAMIKSELHYLLIGSLGLPQFYRANLFEIIDNNIFDLNRVSYYNNEFISYLITDDYLSNIDTIKKIIKKDTKELTNFYNYTKHN